MSHPPTVEQQAVIDAYRTGADLIVEAGAGTGKTSTLRMLAASTPGRKGVYLAYNRSIANDAAQVFPRDVVCKTAHGFAFAAVGRQYAHRLNAPRLPARLAAQYLGITQPIHFVRDKAPLSPTQLARIALAAVKRFCTSADIQIEPWHIARIAGLDDDPVHKLVQQAILPIAVKAWEDINQIHGREWNRVRIAGDFREPGFDKDTGEREPIRRDDAMLAYVSVTRARQVLDRHGLAWIDDFVTAATPKPPAAVKLQDNPVVVRVQKGCGCMLCDPASRDSWPAPLPAGAS